MSDIGRPSDYTEDLAAAICVRLSDGESLKGICSDAGMPHRATVFRWLAAHEAFRDMYARAREEQADTLADSIVGIADGTGEEDSAVMVARDRLRMDAHKWVAAKLKPRKYGEKVQTELTGANGGPIETVTRFKLADLGE